MSTTVWVVLGSEAARRPGLVDRQDSANDYQPRPPVMTERQDSAQNLQARPIALGYRFRVLVERQDSATYQLRLPAMTERQDSPPASAAGALQSSPLKLQSLGKKKCLV